MLHEEILAGIAAAAKVDTLPPFSPVCLNCVHNTGFRKCKAFGNHPIPVSIWRGDDDHTTSWPGDRGIRFEGAV